jgi:hypothetical protein
MLDGLSDLEQQGQPVPDWVLGGGTALMLHANHRLSRDIDAFIDDPQYLALLSPETTDVWNCSAGHLVTGVLVPAIRQ